MTDLVIAGCDPLPPDTTMAIGYHPDAKVAIIMFTNPQEERGFYWPITLEDARKMGQMLSQICEIADNANKRHLDS
jgi:hypothetical protein